MTNKKNLIWVLISMFSFSVFAGEKVPDSVKKVVSSLQEWGKDPAIVEFVNQHNKKGLTLTKIKERDDTWKKTTGVDSFMKAMMENKAAKRMFEFK